MSTSAQFIGVYELVTPLGDMDAYITETGEIEYTLYLPDQDLLDSARYPLVEGAPGKYFVDFQATGGGSLSDFEIQSTSLGIGLSVINFVTPNSFRAQSKDGFVAFTRVPRFLSQGKYVYSEGDSFNLTMEVAAELSKEARRQVTVRCSLDRTILRATELSATFELEDRFIAAEVGTTVADFFGSAGETCSKTDLRSNDGIFVVAAATKTKVYMKVGESTVFALYRVE
ncbi:hypothetical protein FOZ63_025534 [Perkinsus olseni]|uniref:Uncharacterized protein n=1 Tax=Perkinsus olseni TaxID=32597 RepID=A0A7J6RFX2_PEROL|nr:hypothetical protein FOZ62_019298 [Perkinsus olseni]KAF4751605.1 hypothetical protein FOZ63_025534 [Perkinsus olseni]